MLSTELVFELFVLKAKIKDVFKGCIVVMAICFIKKDGMFQGYRPMACKNLQKKA